MSGGIVSSRAPTPRTGHVAIAYDHYMFVWGGYQNELTERYLSPDELWIYDSYLDSWQLRILEPEEDTSINCPPGTSGASAVLKGDAVYLFGGHCYAGNTNELYRLNLQEFCWEYVHSNSLKPSPRDKLSMWEYGNSLYVFGGFGPPLEGYLKEHGIWIPDESSSSYRGWNNQLLVFDLKIRMWSNPKCSGPVPSPRAAHAATRVGNKVYLFGGRHCSQRLNDLHCLNLDTMTWSGSLHTGGSIPVGRSWHTFSAVSSTEIFLYGGFTQDNDTLCDGWVLNVDKLMWQQLNFTKKERRLWHSTCVTNQNDVLIFGGCCNNILSDDEPSLLTNSLLVFRLTPKSLFRLSLDATFKYRAQLYCEWTSLPKPIFELLEAKASAKDDSTQKYDRQQGHGVCVLS